MLYKDAGVNLERANKVVEIVKKITLSHDVIGGFGGIYDLSDILKNYRHPVLVTSTDGVGTKIKLALEVDYLEPIGIDLVAMCVNDILTLGASPLFFLDYYATGKINEKTFKVIIEGIIEGLKISGGQLLGGETAELPGMISSEIFDVAGFVVGVVEKDLIPRKESITAGDLIWGIPSNGIHSNGFSLVRKIIEEAGIDLYKDYGTGEPIYKEILKPTRIYVPEVKKLLGNVEIKGMAHITGGGLIENVKRVIPESLYIEIDWDSWNVPWIFRKLQEWGDVPTDEMRRVFNMGIGYVIITPPSVKLEGFFEIGRVTEK